MAIKDQAITVCYRAWNTSTNAPQTGDASNHTLKLVQDGVEAAPTNSPTEVDSTNLPGVYALALTAGDMNFNNVYLGGKSSTANVVLFGGNIPTDRGILPTSFPANFPSQSIDSSGRVLLQPTQTGVTIPTVTTVTNQLTAAQIATGVWQDATSGDFTTASSIGKCLYIANVAPGAAGGHFIAGSNATTTVNITGNLSGSVGSVTGAVGSVTGAVGSVTGNVGGNVVGSVASVSGAVGSVTGNVGGSVGSVTGAVGSVTGNVGGSVASVTAAVTVSLTEALSTPRSLNGVADGSITLNDAMWCAVAAAAGKESVSGTTYLVQTPSTGTTIRTFTLDSGTSPTTRT